MTQTMIAAVYVVGMLCALTGFRWAGVTPPLHLVIGWPWLFWQIVTRLPAYVMREWRESE